MKLGDKILINHRLLRCYANGEKVWTRMSFRQPREVMVIGKRTLNNGTVQYGSDAIEDPTIYTPSKYFPALLVVEDIARKPFFVHLPEQAK